MYRLPVAFAPLNSDRFAVADAQGARLERSACLYEPDEITNPLVEMLNEWPRTASSGTTRGGGHRQPARMDTRQIAGCVEDRRSGLARSATGGQRDVFEAAGGRSDTSSRPWRNPPSSARAPTLRPTSAPRAFGPMCFSSASLMCQRSDWLKRIGWWSWKR